MKFLSHANNPPVLQGAVRGILHSLFEVDKFEEFASADCVDPSVIEDFETGATDGPDVDDIRIDFKGKLNSKWNERAIDLLTIYVIGELKEVKQLRLLPRRSDDYIRDIIVTYIKNAMTPYRNAQPKLLASGRVESPEELEQRLIVDRDKLSQKARAKSRRNEVSL
jgi:hypothetical protein